MRSPQSLFSSKRFSKTRRFGRSKRRFPVLRMLLLVLIVAIVCQQIDGYFRTPQAVLVLGGEPQREVFAAQFAQEHPALPVWISSGAPPEYAEWVFSQAGIARDRLHLDYNADDTVTNFTTLVDDFKTRDIRSIYLITSDYHMRRAQIIAEIVLGSRNIDFRPVSVPSERSPESIEKVLRDAARSVLWVTTGHTGSSLGRFFRQR